MAAEVIVPPVRRPSIVTRFHGLLFLALVAVTIAAYVNVPANLELPMHWGRHGEPDWLWPRDIALSIAPTAALVLLGLFGLVGNSALPQHLEAGGHVLRVALAGLLGLMAVVQFGLLMIGIGSDIEVIRILCGAVAVFLFIFGNELRGAQPQPYAGLRLPWTLRDPRVWSVVHQLTGGLFMLGSIVLVLVTWLWPDPATLIFALVGAILLPVGAGGVLSLTLARRRRA